MRAEEIRSRFISYFERSAGHTVVPSSPVVPYDDPTLLFTNAGMNQFKDVFLGRGSRAYTRAVDTQKCIRAGGKHNDLEDVGRDVYHHTFFEMLGNWSFGDYFKEESIRWAWELLTKEFGLPGDRLYATWFEGNEAAGLKPDHEARDFWLRYLPADHVVPGNMKDNFWEMGETGPCGPCSEIHFDRIGGRNAASRVNSGDPDVLEIWNLVFIQFNREADKSLKVLPAQHVDTGMGLERLVSVMQGKRSNYDTDLWAPIFAAITEHTGARKYQGVLDDPVDTAYRVIADHIRCLTVAACDGAGPGNDGRNYVLRRILRRAARHGRQTLGVNGPFLHSLVPSVVATLGGAFPEIAAKAAVATEIIRAEEEAFARTMDRGLALFDEAAARSAAHAHGVSTSAQGVSTSAQGASAGKSGALILAQDAFKLHDTFGFPIDLTEVMAKERGMEVDTAGYEVLMEKARETSRAGATGAEAKLELPPDAIAKLASLSISPTDDSDRYQDREQVARVAAIWDGQAFVPHTTTGCACGLVMDRTNFYAESGGQEGDHGAVRAAHLPRLAADLPSEELLREGDGVFRVTDTQAYGGYVLHLGCAQRGRVNVGDEVVLHVDRVRRVALRSNHTSTHLVNWALREVVGDDVDQKGSLVAADKLRFDYSSRKPLDREQIARVESIVNEWIRKDASVDSQVAQLSSARDIHGLRAVFGERYPDPVRVVSIGASVADLLANPSAPQWRNASVEFCGGTHLPSTGGAGRFVLLSDGALAAGVRRVFGLTGAAALAAEAAAVGVGQRIDAASSLQGEALEAEIAEVVRLESSLSLGVSARARLAPMIDALRERSKAARKAAEGSAKAAVGDAVRALVAAHIGGPLVAEVAGADGKALQSGVELARQLRPETSVMLLSAEPAGGKVALVAACSKQDIAAGLKAGDWVKAAAAEVGGAGGGKPDMAQAGGKDGSKLPQALATAKSFAARFVS